MPNNRRIASERSVYRSVVGPSIGFAVPLGVNACRDTVYRHNRKKGDDSTIGGLLAHRIVSILPDNVQRANQVLAKCRRASTLRATETMALATGESRTIRR